MPANAQPVVDATDENGKPAPSILMLAVVDKNVLTLADEKTHRVMPTHFLLTSEVARSRRTWSTPTSC